jgi:hypothetical protein
MYLEWARSELTCYTLDDDDGVWSVPRIDRWSTELASLVNVLSSVEGRCLAIEIRIWCRIADTTAPLDRAAESYSRWPAGTCVFCRRFQLSVKMFLHRTTNDGEFSHRSSTETTRSPPPTSETGDIVVDLQFNLTFSLLQTRIKTSPWILPQRSYPREFKRRNLWIVPQFHL